MGEAMKVNGIRTLDQVQPGEKARVSGLLCKGMIRRRLMDIGLSEQTEVECVGRSPMGDPSAYCIRGAIIAIRAEDGRKILVES